MFKAFNDELDKVTLDHLIEAASKIVPLAQLRKEDIEASRAWARERCEFAQAEEPIDLKALNKVVMESAFRAVNLN